MTAVRRARASTVAEAAGAIARRPLHGPAAARRRRAVPSPARDEQVAKIISMVIIALLIAACVGIVTAAANRADAAPAVPATQPASQPALAAAGPELSCPAPISRGGTSLSMTFRVEGDTAGLSGMQVDFGDGAVAPAAGGAVLTHAYQHPGAYLVVMNAVDHAGAPVTASCMTDWVLDAAHP